MTEPAPSMAADGGWREHWRALRAEVAAPRSVPRAGRRARVRYGLAQPFMGLRIVMRWRDLLGLSLAPVVGVMLVAGFVGYDVGSQKGTGRGFVAFLGSVAALAPLPSLVFGRVYARLAAQVREHLGLPPHAPYLRGMAQVIGEWVALLVIVALGVLPLVGLARLVPVVGPALALGLQGLWALHWIVVEGYDNARTLPPGRTVAQVEAEIEAEVEVEVGAEAGRVGGAPWFHRPYDAARRPRPLAIVTQPLRMLSEVMVSLARPWRREVDLVEEYPWVSLGFGLGVAAMLAVPGLNLLFRSAVVTAGVHLRHRLLDPPRVEPGRTGTTQPYPAVR